jgi:hypothetical protein
MQPQTCRGAKKAATVERLAASYGHQPSVAAAARAWPSPHPASGLDIWGCLYGDPTSPIRLLRRRLAMAQAPP